MRAERADILASPIVRLEEGVDAHGQVAPPNRIAQIDGLVGSDVDVVAKSRSGAFVLLGESNVAVLCGYKNKDDYVRGVLNILKGGKESARAIRKAIKECFGLEENEEN